MRVFRDVILDLAESSESLQLSVSLHNDTAQKPVHFIIPTMRTSNL